MRSYELEGMQHGDQTLLSWCNYSEQFNSAAGAPCSAVNGFPLHLLVKSSPLKGSLRFAMNSNLLLCFLASVAVTGGPSWAVECQVLPIPIEPWLAAPVPRSLFPAPPCLARAAAYAAPQSSFRGEHGVKNKQGKPNKGTKRMEPRVAAFEQVKSQAVTSAESPPIPGTAAVTGFSKLAPAICWWSSSMMWQSITAVILS